MRHIFLLLTVSILAAIAATESDSTQYPAEGCPPGWIGWTGSEASCSVLPGLCQGCFLFYFAKVLTWADSQLECEKLGGFLAEPRGEEQAELLTTLAFVEESVHGVQSWWLGLSDRGHEGRWIWQHTVEDVSYTNWAPGAPSGSDISKDCAIMNSGEQFKWSDENCLQARAAPICQRVTDVATTAEPDTTAAATTTEASTHSQYTLELRGGDGFSSGNVFVTNENGFFGPVCDDNWQDVDAQVVCRQLGFSDGNATTYSYFGSVDTDEFAMDDVDCTGSEDYLQECQYMTSDNCGPGEGAGVLCDSPQYYVELRGGDGVSSGNVFALNADGYFGPVCDDLWGDVDAGVVCRQLGFMDGSATEGSYFGSADTRVYSMDSVGCTGSEEYLQECQYETFEDCNYYEGAGVICI